ncbi:MAG: hypothetical protein WCK49_00055 [Myxococcaceae bacterium]
MKHLFCIVFVFLSACGPQPDRAPKKIEYMITLQDNGFLVEIKHDGTQRLNILGLSREPSLESKILRGTEEYPVRYTVTPKKLPLPRIRALPTIFDFENGFFQTVGHAFLMCTSQMDSKKSIRITWKGRSNWKFANSFSATQNEQNFEANCDELRAALYTGGSELTLYKTWFGVLALIGEFKTLDIHDIEDALKRNMERVLEFWDSEPDEHYFIALSSKKDTAFGGTAHLRSFQINLPEDLKPYQLDHLITHEYFHNWNGLRINQLPSVNNDHLDVWWFVEGFTDYYAYLLNKIPDTEVFQNIGLAELKQKYSDTDDTYSKIPYIQGRRIAGKLDGKIRTHSGKELKHVMHEIIKLSEKNPNYYLTRENILGVICIGGYMSCTEATEILRNHVDLGMSF